MLWCAGQTQGHVFRSPWCSVTTLLIPWTHQSLDSSVSVLITVRMPILWTVLFPECVWRLTVDILGSCIFFYVITVLIITKNATTVDSIVSAFLNACVCVYAANTTVLGLFVSVLITVRMAPLWTVLSLWVSPCLYPSWTQQSHAMNNF